MTRFDVMMGKETNKKEEKNKITLEFDEGDNILLCIKQGLEDNKIKSADVTSVDGKIKEGIIKTNLEQVKIEDAEILKAKGKFKFGGDELWGSLQIFTEGKKPIEGQLLKGIASNGLKLIFEY